MENKKKDTMIKDSLILCAITLIAGLLLGVIYDMTKEPIAQRKIIEKQNTYRSVYETAVSFEESEELAAKVSACQSNWDANGSEFGKVAVNEALYAKDADGTVIGYIVSATSKEGYGGDVQVAMGIRLDGYIEGVSILDMNETVGLGARAKEPAFLSQYMNKSVDRFLVTTTGASAENEIDAMTSSTITSKAVTNAINAALAFVSDYAE